MGHVPEDTEWFVAGLIMEILVDGDRRNVVHRNLTLVRARNPEAAYEAAIRWGLEGETSYENTEAKRVEIKFRGVSKLDAVIYPLEDGCELTFEQLVDVPSAEIERWVPSKGCLEAFRPPPPFHTRRSAPDYSSREILKRVGEMLSPNVAEK